MKGFQFRRTQKHCHKKKFYSCGDLTIFPIREIRGTNRILYGCEHSWAGDWAGAEPVYTELLPRYEHLSSCTTSRRIDSADTEDDRRYHARYRDSGGEISILLLDG